MYTLADYLEHYEDCKRTLDLIKEIAAKKRVKEIPRPLIAKELREKLLYLFSKPELSKICKKCEGLCCTTCNFNLTPLELLLFVSAKPKFEFPDLDWRFLGRESKRRLEINDPCLFLSDRGCLLRECRPMICLLFYCPQPHSGQNSLEEKVIKIFPPEERIRFRSEYEIAKEDFCRKVLEASGVLQDSILFIEAKGALIRGIVGSPISLEILEKITK